MRAYVTSIGEATTEDCIWALERLGYEVKMIFGASILADKLAEIYHDAEDDFLRVDADVIVNKNVLKLECPPDVWWLQARTFDWWKQDIMYGGVQLIKKEALPVLRLRIKQYRFTERPETMMSRLEEFHNPRRFQSSELVCGIHGYGQDDMQRVKDTKDRRHQDGYDWALAERLSK